MIISHSRKFIFVKCRKTASTSVERFLHPSLGPEDTWTPLSNPTVAGNNFYSAWLIEQLAARSSLLRRLLSRRRLPKLASFADHAGIGEIRQKLGDEITGRYFKFCFDRNPWDFAVSLYFHHRSKGRLRNIEFDEFVFTYPIPQNRSLYTIGGQVAVDAVFRYEDLEEALSELSHRLGLAPAVLTSEKSLRRPIGHYRQYYSQASRDEVARRWEDTIRLLGYDF